MSTQSALTPCPQWKALVVMLSKLVSEEIDKFHFLGVYFLNCKKSVDRIIFFHHKMCNTILLAQLYWKSNKSSPLPRLPHFCSCSLFKTKINSWSSSMPLKATFTKHAKTCFLRVFCLFHIESYFKKICLVSTFECKLG